MKHLKIFEESWYDEPKVGDYVICTESYYSISMCCLEPEKVIDFLSQNIGQIVYEDSEEFSSFHLPTSFLVSYESANLSDFDEISLSTFEYDPKTRKNNCRCFSRKEILHFSPNKRDLSIYVDVKKYNL